MLQDFLATMRPFAPDPAAFDAFVKQWFHEVVVPEYRLSDARVDAERGKGVEGDRPGEERRHRPDAGRGGGRSGASASARTDKPKPGYRDARTTVILGAGEERTVEIPCPFRPERLVVDPDVKVLQLRRKSALVKL